MDCRLTKPTNNLTGGDGEKKKLSSTSFGNETVRLKANETVYRHHVQGDSYFSWRYCLTVWKPLYMCAGTAQLTRWVVEGERRVSQRLESAASRISKGKRLE